MFSCVLFEKCWNVLFNWCIYTRFLWLQVNESSSNFSLLLMSVSSLLNFKGRNRNLYCRLSKMAACGTCHVKVSRNYSKSVNRKINGISFKSALVEYLNFSPSESRLCLECDRGVELIVKINLRVKKLSRQRDAIIRELYTKITQTHQPAVGFDGRKVSEVKFLNNCSYA